MERNWNEMKEWRNEQTNDSKRTNKRLNAWTKEGREGKEAADICTVPACGHGSECANERSIAWLLASRTCSALCFGAGGGLSCFLMISGWPLENPISPPKLSVWIPAPQKQHDDEASCFCQRLATVHVAWMIFRWFSVQHSANKKCQHCDPRSTPWRCGTANPKLSGLIMLIVCSLFCSQSFKSMDKVLDKSWKL